MNRQKKTLIFAIVILATILLFIANLKMYMNKQNIKNSDDFTFGVDVSKYQGKIDFDLFFSQGAKFVFIKATEGIDHLDENFYENFEAAKNSKMRVGAYHFFRFELDGKAQAQNFINIVGENLDLPPVLDAELYGEYVKNPPKAGDVDKNMEEFLSTLREFYKKEPIIYCNISFYEKYIAGKFENSDIWIASLEKNPPKLYDNRDWTFWQYSHTGSLKGFDGNGNQKYIDFNYFNGDEKIFEKYGR